MATIDFNVSGITCGGCERSIRNALLARDGVRDASASHGTGVVRIDYDEDRIERQALVATIQGAGFEVGA